MIGLTVEGAREFRQVEPEAVMATPLGSNGKKSVFYLYIFMHQFSSIVHFQFNKNIFLSLHLLSLLLLFLLFGFLPLSCT